MTQDELDALIRAQQGQLATNALNQAAGVYSQLAQRGQQGQTLYGQLGSPYGPSSWSNSTATARSVLEDHEKREIRMQEREACFQLVMDMAEELNCPNLLHGVALAIKARRTE